MAPLRLMRHNRLSISKQGEDEHCSVSIVVTFNEPEPINHQSTTPPNNDPDKLERCPTSDLPVTSLMLGDIRFCWHHDVVAGKELWQAWVGSNMHSGFPAAKWPTFHRSRFTGLLHTWVRRHKFVTNESRGLHFFSAAADHLTRGCVVSH